MVTVLSTNSQPYEEDVVQQRQHNGSRMNVRCPSALAKYQQFMGGVDRNDQLRQYYQVPRKFYRYIFCFLFEAAVTNSFILHSNYSTALHQATKRVSSRASEGPCGRFPLKKRHNRHPAPPTSLTLLHLPMKRQNTTSTTLLRGRCWYCWHKRRPQQRRDTQWYCHECQLHLCHNGDAATDCFLQHHQK